MTDSISFGKGKNTGKVDLTKVKEGLTKQQIAGNNKKLQSIFDKVDTSGNGILEQDELLKFQEELAGLAGEDNQLTDKEAKGFKDAGGHKMGRRHRKTFYEFLNKLAANEQEPQVTQQTAVAPEAAQEIVASQENPTEIKEESPDGAEVDFDVITLPDGSTKKVPFSKIENKGLPNETTTYYFCDDNGDVTKAVTTGDGKQVTTFYGESVEYDKLGETKPEKQIIIDNKHTATVVTYNEQGNKIEAVYSNVSAGIGEDDKLHVSFLDDEHKTTFTEYDSSNNKLAQTVEKNGKKYDVSYDGEGNTNITVQYRETPEAIAEKFGCDVDELIELNGGNREAFATGARIKVPGELEADSAVLQGRGTSSQEVKKQQNAKTASARQQRKAAAQKAAQAECKARKVVSHKIEDKLVYVKDKGWQSVYTFDLKTDKGILHYLYNQEGQRQATSSSFNARLKQLRDLNPGRFDKDGKLLEPDKPLNLPVAPALAQQWGAEAIKQNDREIMYTEHDNASTGRRIAKDAYSAIAGAGTNVANLTKAVNSLNQNNIVGFLDSYNNSYGESFVKAIRGESKIKGHQEEGTYINKVKSTLLARSKALGLDHADLLKSITTQTSTKDIEKIFNRVLSDIKSIEILAPSERKAAIENMKGGLTHDDVKGMRDAGVANKKEADRILENQLKQDGFFGDLYEGLKWCVGSSQLDEKVKADINKFQTKLNAVVTKYNKSHNIEEFKSEFKAQFGVECDPQLLKQYTNLTAQIQKSQNLDFVEDYFKGHERKSETQLRKLLTDLQKENPNIFGEGVDINNLSKKDMNNIVNSIVNYTREQKGNSISWTSDLIEARQEISRQLFGSQNDVIFRAMDYADSQRQGAGYLKMGTKIVAAIVGGALTGGIGGAALVAGASSLAIDVGDAEYRAGVNDGEHMSMDEFGSALTEAATNAGMVLLGGAYYKAVGELTNLSQLAKAGMLTTLDITSGAAVEKMMTGEITIEGTVFNAIFSATGNLVGLKAAKGKSAGEATQSAPTPVESETPNLSKAVKQQNADGSVQIADASRVHVGEAKAKDIAAEIEGLAAKEEVTPQELAKARSELDGISNRDLRRDLQAQLDDKGQNLSGYTEQVRADQKALAEKVAGKHEITPGDARVVKEYVKNTENIAELEAFMNRFDPTKPGHRPTRKIVEDRINALKPNARSASEVQTEVHAALDKAIADNKGLPSLNDLKQHLNSTTDLSELNQLFDKWMKIRKNCGSNRKQIDTLFREKGFDISKPNQRPVTHPEAKVVADNAEPVVRVEEHEPVAKTEEPIVRTEEEPVVPAEEAEVAVQPNEVADGEGVVVSADEDIIIRANADETPNAEGVVVAGKEEISIRGNANEAAEAGGVVISGSEEFVITPESIAHDAQSIPAAEIPAEHRNLWKNCQERIGKLFSTGKELAKGEVKTVLEDIKTLCNAVKDAKIKTQLKNLYNNVVAYAKSKQASKPAVADTPAVESGAIIVQGGSVEVIHPNASGQTIYSTDAKGFIHKENYSKMSPDELVAEYRRLSEYESNGVLGWSDPSPSGKIFRTNTHDMSGNKYEIRQALEERGLKLTRDHSKGGDIPEYGYTKVEKSEPALTPEQAQRVREDFEDPSTLSDEELLSGIKRLNNRRRYIDRNGVEKETNHTRRLRELKAELKNRGLTIKDGQLVKAETPAATPRGVSQQEIGEIGDAINRAKNGHALDQAQAKIDRLPDSPQKKALQRQANEKSRELRQAEEPIEGRRATSKESQQADLPEAIIEPEPIVEPEPIKDSQSIDEADLIVDVEVASPHDSLVFDIQEQLQCKSDLAEQLATKMEANPEMLPHFEKLLKSGRDYDVIDNIIRIATTDNIETLMGLSKNKKLGIVYNVDGSISRNDFEIILKIADANPVNKTQLLDIATNTQRGQTDIYLISELMKKYPDNVADITRLTKSNQNIKVGYDLNNNLSRNIDEIIAQMNNKPQLRDEILDFMSVQRRALNDTTDPVQDLTLYIHILEKHTKNKQFITALAKDHNLTPFDINTFLKRYQNNPQALADIQGLAGKQFTADMIENKLKRIRKFPELRKIMLSDGPSYNLIDKTVVNTPVETIQQRFTIRENIEKFAADDLATLRTTLGDEFYPKVKWEEIIPKNATEKEIRAILADINENSKFFARTAGNERKYGKNIKWASEMGDISRSAQTQIKNGESFEDVISSIANDYRAYDEASTFNSNMDLDDRREWSGIYRGNMGKQDGKFGATTGISDYPTYRERFHKMANQARTYKGIELTTFGPYAKRGSGLYMLHPTNQNVKPAMKLIERNYKNLQPLVKKVQKGGTLTPEEINFAHEQIAESYYLMGNVMPWARGSNGISDLYMRSLYKTLNIEQPALKHGVSLDLEAFTMTMDEYKANWNSFFEDRTVANVAEDFNVDVIAYTPSTKQTKKPQRTYNEQYPETTSSTQQTYQDIQEVIDLNNNMIAAEMVDDAYTPIQDFPEATTDLLDDIIIYYN